MHTSVSSGKLPPQHFEDWFIDVYTYQILELEVFCYCVPSVGIVQTLIASIKKKVTFQRRQLQWYNFQFYIKATTLFI